MIAMREDGFELDRFVLTKDPNYFPTGIGPALACAPPVIGRMSVVDGSLAINRTGGGEIEVASSLDGP